MRHTFKEGFLDRCQICDTKKIFKVLDLGFQPLADDLINETNKNNPCTSYPLKVYLCKSCRLLQNNFIVSDKKLYNKNYHYRPGISNTVEKNLNDLALKISKLYKLDENDLIVDVGCSDGTLLNAFKKQGYKNVVGIEPTNTYKFAKRKKITTYNDFFNSFSAKKIKKKHGEAKLIITTNVFAHTGELKEFILGIKILLKKKTGIFILENHYLKEIISKLQFDSFYHEHLRTYSLKSLIKLMSIYKFNIIDAYTTSRYNGNIQAHFAINSKRKSFNVKKILDREDKSKLEDLKTYKKFSQKIEKSKKDLFNYLNKYKNLNVVGKAYPARASVILHHYSFLKDKIKFIAEQPTSLKINNYISGTSIKIINSEKLKKLNPDVLVIFAWHLFDEIKKKWKKKGLKTKYVLLLPKLRIFK